MERRRIPIADRARAAWRGLVAGGLVADALSAWIGARSPAQASTGARR